MLRKVLECTLDATDMNQSALAMILIREFGLQVWNMTVHDEVKTLVHVQRNCHTSVY